MVKLAQHSSHIEAGEITVVKIPDKVYIPLSQHIGRPVDAQVQPGENVVVGQCIGVSNAAASARVHASIAGKVIGIQDWPHPVLGYAKAVVIQADGRDSEWKAEGRGQKAVEDLSADDIRTIVQECGIVGMGGASFPTHIKLDSPKPIDTLIVNGAECEPYLSADYRLMLEKAQEILQGAALIARCVGAKKIIIAIEDNKPKAVQAFRENSAIAQYELKVLRSFYPQGGEKQLIKNVLGKEIPSGKLPFDIGVLVQNVATVYAVYEAVYFAKPLYERVVTIAGPCMPAPKNMLARVGTPIRDLIEQCGPLVKDPQRIVVGGPMMGVALARDIAPVIKSTNGILLLDERSLRKEESVCIRCGSCVYNCPAGLMPCVIDACSRKESWQLAASYGCLDCIECGACDYVCPASRRLVQAIKLAKLSQKI